MPTKNNNKTDEKKTHLDVSSTCLHKHVCMCVHMHIRN